MIQKIVQPDANTFIGTISSFDAELLFVQSWANSAKPHYHFIFLHGVGGDSNALLGSIQQTLGLIDNCRCTAYDLRGHGLSSKKFPKNVDSIEKIGALDLQAVTNYFAIKKIIPVGNCFAGMIMLAYVSLQLQPQFEQAIFINTPLSTRVILPFPRKWWLWLLQSLPPSKTHKLRSWEFHLKFKNSFDLHPIRVWHDFADNGFICLMLNELAIINWHNIDYQAIDRPGFIFMTGDQDFIFPVSFQQKSLKPLKSVQKKLYHMNHHQIFTKHPSQLAKELASIVR